MQETVDVSEIRNYVNRYRRSHLSPPLKHEPKLSSLSASVAGMLGEGVTQQSVYDNSSTQFNVGSYIMGNGKTNEEYTKLVVDEWYSSSLNYDYVTPPGDVRSHPFSRMMWASARTFGIALVKSSSQDRMWVVMALPPRANPSISYSTNVQPPGLNELLSFDNIYTKNETDAKFLNEGNLDTFLENARAGGIEAADSNMEVFRAEVESEYYKKHEVDAKIDVDITNDLDDLATRLTNDYYTNVRVDEKLEGVREGASTDLHEAKSTLRGEMSVLDTYVMEEIYNKAETDEELTTLRGYVDTDFYDRTQTDSMFTTYSTVAAMDALKLRLSTDFFDANDTCNIFATQDLLNTQFATKSLLDSSISNSYVMQKNELVNDVFYPRTASDERYALKPSLRELEDRLDQDYYTSAEADGVYMSTSNVTSILDPRFDTFRQELLADDVYGRSEADDIFITSTELEAYTQSAIDQTLVEKVHTKTESDARFAPLSLQATLTNDYDSREASDERYTPRSEFVEFRTLAPRLAVYEASLAPPVDGGNARVVDIVFETALKDTLEETDEQGETILVFTVVPVLVCSDTNNASGLGVNVISRSTTGASVVVYNARGDRTGWTIDGDPVVELHVIMRERTV